MFEIVYSMLYGESIRYIHKIYRPKEQKQQRVHKKMKRKRFELSRNGTCVYGEKKRNHPVRESTS